MMTDYRQKLFSLAIEIPSILLPVNSQSSDMQKWPVIACDQFTQDRDYWGKVKAFSDGFPSTLNLIFPEVFLSDGNASERIADIHSAMKRYLQDGILGEPRYGFIYIERDTPYNKKRRGLIAAIDLEQYDWKSDERPLIRCTEGTVPERLPARMDVRRGAPLELPHVLVLIDDDKDVLLPGIAAFAKKTAPVYSTALMMDSGSVTGWFLDAGLSKSSAVFSFAAEKFDELYQRSISRYADGKPFLFAVGDGNHSLAAAKGIWEEYKAAHSNRNHPCRYALVEIENIYDPAIQFEPIHRVVFGLGFNETISLLSQLPAFSCRHVKNRDELIQFCSQSCAANCFGVISEGRYALIEISEAGIATACLQPLLDAALAAGEIDYIHDEEELFRLASLTERKTSGILLPPVQKAGLFDTVARFGPLPRKSFSMGHSSEKRFYLECRELFSN